MYPPLAYMHPGSIPVRHGTINSTFMQKKLLVVVLGRCSVEELVSVEARFDGK